eukprot:CAMPEP_0184649822 /NCGR_PEP_ID=MMETSP0308-20130426/7244_1 /TAXON_ID=38269 /ORGANISM="Gloeochaete witrockiana, Strain SAG 46.84" /LENGTH=561 /DNA_ID=CAMNT_0027082847 /DNA_START=77 /DNA_END=1759 /DNA_ORIENTATION=-
MAAGKKVKIVIIGGVAGGATAATKARRENENAEIVLLERGPYVSWSNCAIPMFVGEEIKNRDSLFVTTAASLKARYNIDARTFHNVVKIDREKKEVHITKADGQNSVETYDKLIISTGAESMVPPLTGAEAENVFTAKTVPDADQIKKWIGETKPQKAVVLGGGFIGLEMAEAFVHLKMDVTVVDTGPLVMNLLDADMGIWVQNHLISKGVKVHNGSPAKSITVAKNKDGKTIGTEVVLANGTILPAEIIIMSVGVRPEVGLAKAADLTLGPTGGILVDEYMRTNDPSIYAVGDIAEYPFFVNGERSRVALAGPANRAGRVAGSNAATQDEEVFAGTARSWIIEVLGLAAAATGLNEKGCQERNIPYHVSIVHPLNHISAYPGGTMLHIKLLTEKGTDRILGAQIVGDRNAGVDKRCDVIATAIYAKLKGSDLAKLDLCYSPQFSSAKDPVLMAGFQAANLHQGKLKNLTLAQLMKHMAGNGTPSPPPLQILDVRDDNERERDGIIGVPVGVRYVHIPLNSLRGRITEVDKNIRVVAHCQSGLRSYLACRILSHHGYEDVW